MKQQLGYPYSYGDEGGSVTFDYMTFKCALIAMAVFSSFSIAPSICYALDNTTLLESIAASAAANNKRTIVGANPFGATMCVISGFCLAQAKRAYLSGDIPKTGGFICASAIAFCGERVVLNMLTL